MNALSARRAAGLLAIVTMGMVGCDSQLSTAPGANPGLSGSSSPTFDVISQVFQSSNQVTTWDPIIPAAADPNWPTSICTTQPQVGPGADWQNPHNAYVLSGHPWASLYFSAPWINAWGGLGSIGPDGQSWTKYETQVSGNGAFVIRLLADNCSWVYLDGACHSFRQNV